MSGVQFSYTDVSAESKSWGDWVELMNDTRSDLNAMTSAGFTPDVKPSATTFLDKWFGLATTMRDQVETVEGALTDTTMTWRAVDDGVSEGYSRKDD